MPDNIVTEYKKYIFSEPELRDLGEELARQTQLIVSWEREKSEISALLNAKIKEASNRCRDLADKVTSGFEQREIECVIAYDSPAQGWKRYLSVQTGDVVREAEMSVEERMQARLDFDQGG